jgi:hypothetical protein
VGYQQGKRRVQVGDLRNARATQLIERGPAAELAQTAMVNPAENAACQLHNWVRAYECEDRSSVGDRVVANADRCFDRISWHLIAPRSTNVPA